MLRAERTFSSCVSTGERLSIRSRVKLLQKGSTFFDGAVEPGGAVLDSPCWNWPGVTL